MGTSLAIGAGPEQLGAIRKAQALGHRVLALDGNPRAPGLAVADQGLVVDIRDEAAVVDVARAHGVAFTLPVPIGRLLTTQAAVHEALGLRGVRYRTAQRCTDKRLFHATLAAAGLALPDQLAVRDGDELAQADGRDWPYPVVLKPTHGAGSRGVAVLPDHAGWLARRGELVASGHYAQGAVVERFIEGTVLGIDGAVVAGQLAITLVREKEMTPLPHRVELAHRAPARLPPAAPAVIRQSVERALQALEADDCVFHADAVWTAAGELRLIEMSARPAGLMITLGLVPACTGVDFVAEAIRLHAGGRGDFEPRRQRPTLLHYWHTARPGRVTRLPTEARLRALPHVLDCRLTLRPGQHLQVPAHLGELMANGYILIGADAWEDVDGTLRHALSLLEIEPHAPTQSH